MLGELSALYVYQCVIFSARCLSKSKNLDALSGQRNQTHTELATSVFSRTKLSRTYGILKELVVSVDIHFLCTILFFG